MTTRLEYRFEPLADLWLLLVDPKRAPSGTAWAPAREVIAECLSMLAAAPRGRVLADIAFFGHVAEHRTIEDLESDVPADGVLGLPWSQLVELGAEALRLAWDVYHAEVAEQREAIVREAIETRVRTTLVPKESECLAYVRDSLELDDTDDEFPVILTGSIAGPGAFTSLSDVTGAVCFVGVEKLRGTSLLETIVHEATHAMDGPTSRSGSVLDRLRGAVANRDVWHSLIFVQAGETIRRLVDPSHVHYGVTHTYYDRVPSSKPVLEHWVAHLDGESDADTAIERIAAASSGR